MKYIYFVTMFLLSFSLYAGDLNKLVGEWEQFDTGSEHKYTYFKYNADGTGVFATVRGDNKPSIDSFEAVQVKIEDDILEVDFFEVGEYKAKLILTGYDHLDNGIATGMLYMYIKENKKWKIFNTIFIRLLKINDQSFIPGINELQKLLKKSIESKNQ